MADAAGDSRRRRVVCGAPGSSSRGIGPIGVVGGGISTETPSRVCAGGAKVAAAGDARIEPSNDADKPRARGEANRDGGVAPLDVEDGGACGVEGVGGAEAVVAASRCFMRSCTFRRAASRIASFVRPWSSRSMAS